MSYHTVTGSQHTSDISVIAIWDYRLDNLRVFSVSQLQAWECFQMFTNGVCFLLHRTRFLQ